MKAFNRKTGRLAEDIAARALIELGYTILQQNFATRYGEIDIIAKDKNILVFVEVKAKTGVDFGNPEEMVGRGKLQKVRNMATLYMQQAPLPAGRQACRIDVVAIVFGENDEVLRLTHYKNVY